jgi:hypothetical protein
MVRSLKSGVAEFVEQHPLTYDQKSQLKVSSDISLFSLYSYFPFIMKFSSLWLYDYVYVLGITQGKVNTYIHLFH